MRSAPETRDGGFSPHSVRLAWILAVAYLLVIAYASLQPFRDWRAPPAEVLRFLFTIWPRYITLQDVTINVAAYVPLGFLLSLGLGARLGPARGAAAAALAGAALSLAMELAQMFLPARIASNVDLLTNAFGALVGAMAAPLFAPTRILGGKLHAARHRLFLDGMAADTGLVIAGLWLITQLHPTAQAFATGGIRATFELPARLAHTPALTLGGEAVVVTLSLLGVGLMVSATMRAAPGMPAVIAVLTVPTVFAKSLSVAVFERGVGVLAWLTPGVILGWVAGAAALYAAARLPRLVQTALAAACIAAATVAVNLLPDNPYQNVPPLLLAGGTSHFLSFSGIVRALSELWPFLACAHLCWVAGRCAAGGSRVPI